MMTQMPMHNVASFVERPDRLNEHPKVLASVVCLLQSAADRKKPDVLPVVNREHHANNIADVP
jgi:hypothetical protein